MPQPLPTLFAESSVGLIVLGLLLVAVAFLLRRAGKKSRRSRNRDVAAEVRQQFHEAERDGRREIERLEVRLHDFAREIDALAQTRIAALTELIAAADRAIGELSKHTVTGPLSPEQVRILQLLREAGYGDTELAHLIGRSTDEVRDALNSSTDAPESHAA